MYWKPGRVFLFAGMGCLGLREEDPVSKILGTPIESKTLTSPRVRVWDLFWGGGNLVVVSSFLTLGLQAEEALTGWRESCRACYVNSL